MNWDKYTNKEDVEYAQKILILYKTSFFEFSDVSQSIHKDDF